jgi:hypothetical protein
MNVGVEKELMYASVDDRAYCQKEGTISIDGLTIDVVVTDTRRAYGRLDLCVTPKSGEGSKWVYSKSVDLTTKEPKAVKPAVKEAKPKENTTFRQEVARRKMEAMNSEAEEAFRNIKSFMDIVIKKEETK